MKTARATKASSPPAIDFSKLATPAWTAERLFSELSPYLRATGDVDEARRRVREIRSAVIDKKKLDRRWIPVLLEALAAEPELNALLAFFTSGALKLAGRRAFPPTTGDQLLAAFAALGQKATGDFIELLVAWGDPRTAGVFVDALERWRDAYRVLEGLAALPKKVVGDALSARLAKGPIKLASKSTYDIEALDALYKKLRVHQAVPGAARTDDPDLLHALVTDGDVVGVKRLLAAGADPDRIVDGRAEPPLLSAIECAYSSAAEDDFADRLSIVRLLLAAGAKPTTRLRAHWECVDRYFTKRETALAVVDELLAAVTPPYLSPPRVRGRGIGDDAQFAYIDEETRVVMRPNVKKLATLVTSAGTKQKAPKKLAAGR